MSGLGGLIGLAIFTSSHKFCVGYLYFIHGQRSLISWVVMGFFVFNFCYLSASI